MSQKGIESNFVESWNWWDQPDTAVMQFYGCKLRPDVFDYADENKVYIVTVDSEKSIVTVYDDDTGEVISENSFVCAIVN